MLSLDEVDAVLQDEGLSSQDLQVQQWDAYADRPRRAQVLQDVSATLQELLYSGSEDAEKVAQKLGDASRTPTWRLPLGDAGILDFALGILAMDNVSQPLRMHSLRLIGNCCADTDENRDRVLASNGLTTLRNQLSDDGVLPFTISVLYNVLVDHEPAQLAASNLGLTAQLVTLISGPRVAHCQNVLGMVGMILEILVAHQIEADNAHPNTPGLLLNLTLNPAIIDNPSDSLSLTSVALAYLAFQNLQAEFVNTGNMPVLLASFYNLTSNIETLAFGDEDLTAQVTQVRSTTVQLLSDICYLPAFTYKHPLGSPVLTTLQSWLSPPANAHLQAAACLCLGNVARSDDASAALVSTYKIHTPVLDIVSSQLSQQADAVPQPPREALLLHSALSLLKNLAIPPTNKPTLSALLKPEMLPRIWAMDANASIQTPHLHFVAISLARLILTSTPSNVRILCSPLSPDPLSPLHETTHLHRVLDLFIRADSESAAHTKTEAARAALAVVRVLHTATVTPVLPDWDPNSSDGFVFRPEKPLLPPPSAVLSDRESITGGGGTTRLGKFYRQHGALSRALAYLVTQTKFPVLRSEAWFVFALMSRIKDGGSLVVRILQVPGVWEALVASVTGRDSGAVPEEEKSTSGNVGASSTMGAGQTDFITSPVDSTMGGSTIGGNTVPDMPSVTGVGGGTDAMAVVDGLGLEPQQADPQAAAGMARVDRENGLVLVSELVRHCGNELPASRRAALEVMIKEGGELVLEDRNSDSSEGYGKGKGVAR
ncbi:GTP binding protein [Plectosphaerella plurivora]|uniref:GTP binding protein n=1 Tax=Plectosphaerella plurivora TaxID=936078 RepID=A0A9P9ADZ6_9PEZI|nr:GTP binding protein [Plectosphaerella plurivora]